MILKVVDLILDKQIEEGMISREDTSVYRYGYILVLEVIINITIAIIIGMIFRRLVSVALFLLMLIPLRSYCGGYHASKSWICILLSNAVVMGVVFVVPSLQFVAYTPLLVIEIICIAVILFLAPMQSDAKRVSSDEEQVYKKYIRFVLIAELLLALIFFLIKEKYYGSIIIMAHIIQAVSLLTAYLKQVRPA